MKAFKKSAKTSLSLGKEFLKNDPDSITISSSSYSKKKDTNCLSFYLKKIVLENFKSFQGTKEIGEFLNFSVILGPNGSGKSNILDAICFGLGIRPNSLRTNNLKELIYKNENESNNTIGFRCAMSHFGSPETTSAKSKSGLFFPTRRNKR